MMHDIEDAQATCTALKEIGVGLAIDDFGTGYSSLCYLRQFPIDVLKIAKPFIDAVYETAEDAEFVQGIVQLGHVVGMHVVAEGVERVEQAGEACARWAATPRRATTTRGRWSRRKYSRCCGSRLRPTAFCRTLPCRARCSRVIRANSRARVRARRRWTPSAASIPRKLLVARK